MGSKFLINYLRQKWWYLHFLFATVNLYWVRSGAKYTVQMWTTSARASRRVKLCRSEANVSTDDV